MTLLNDGCMNKFVLCIFLLLLVYSCEKSPKYIKLTDRINEHCVKELKNRYNLCQSGYGGSLMYDVKEVSGSFQVSEPMTIQKAREIYLGIIECYLSEINTDEEIKPYLHNYPFRFDNLDFRLSVSPLYVKEKYLDQWDRDRKNVFLLSMPKNNELIYRTYDYDHEKYEVILRESYEEALKIVKENAGK